MQPTRIWATLGLLLSMLASPWVAAQTAPEKNALPPIEHFFQNEQFASPKLSPDGQRLAFLIAAKGGRARLGVLDLKTMQSRVAISYTAADVARFDWVNDQRLIFTQDAEELGPGLYGVNHDGSGYRPLVKANHSFFKDPLETRELLPSDTRLLGGTTQQNGDEVHVVTPQQNNKQRGVAFITLRRLNTVSGRSDEIDTPLHSFAWLMDRQGELRMVVTIDGDVGAVRLREADGTWASVIDFKARDPASSHPRPLYFSPDGQLYVSAPAHGDKAGIYTYDLKTRKLAATPVLASKDFDLHPRFVANDS